MEFIRFAGTINTHESLKVVKVTVRVVLEDCTGTFYISDLMFQEGKWLSGYVVHNHELLQKHRVDGQIVPAKFYNGLVRTEATVVIPNNGEVSAGLDYRIVPLSDMAAGELSVAHNYGSHKLTMQSALRKDDVILVDSDARLTTRNGQRIRADGFYSYTAAGDSKHHVKVKDRKSAQLRLSFQEMSYGIGGKRM